MAPWARGERLPERGERAWRAGRRRGRGDIQWPWLRGAGAGARQACATETEPASRASEPRGGSLAMGAGVGGAAGPGSCPLPVCAGWVGALATGAGRFRGRDRRLRDGAGETTGSERRLAGGESATFATGTTVAGSSREGFGRGAGAEAGAGREAFAAPAARPEHGWRGNPQRLLLPRLDARRRALALGRRSAPGGRALRIEAAGAPLRVLSVISVSRGRRARPPREDQDGDLRHHGRVSAVRGIGGIGGGGGRGFSSRRVHLHGVVDAPDWDSGVVVRRTQPPVRDGLSADRIPRRRGRLG